ncbi:MAG: HupE/UreJ family protein [Verrucomicrobiia bacterium]
MSTLPRLLLVGAIFRACLSGALAHEAGENYVFLEFHDTFIEGRIEFQYADLKEKIGVDITIGGTVSEERLRTTAPQVQRYITERFTIASGGREYTLHFADAGLFNHEGGWAQYPFRIETGVVPPHLQITHWMGYENDPLHRGVLVIEQGEWPSKSYQMRIAMVFGPNNPTQTLDVRNPPEVMTPARMIWQGVLHIWIGLDHILFLLALALPIVLVRAGGAWAPVPGLGHSLWPLLKIVTVFTIAHSITLGLASLGIIWVPSRLVESMIALSIVLVGINNIAGRSHHTSLLVILVLGLFHGLGFASVMGELPFRIAQLKHFVLTIVGFNLGVELGQVAILVASFPVLFGLRNARLYSPLVLNGGSAVLVCIAGYWLVERAFGLE